ncbi:MAG: endonuclease/exonuclease/phosphatase family protein [Planctomycetes bacterium]|nr:endonuclease/exonuclease/phosphatase family protein [Planctomycetota bacterium]
MPATRRSETPRSHAGRFRVLSWNILEGGVDDGRLDLILALARAQRADVVALQECNGWHHRGAKILRRAERTLRMRAFPFWTTGGYQPVLLTRLDGAREIHHDDQDDFHHGFQEIVLPLPGGREWHFFHTHLSPFLESQRLLETKRLLREMAPHKRGWASLMGDLNSVAPFELYNGVKLGAGTTRLELAKHPLLRFKFQQAGMAGMAGWKEGGKTLALPQIPFRRKRLVKFVEMRTDVYRALRGAGWVDAYRRLHPKDPGFTIPSDALGARIDYAWLSRKLADRLVACDVLSGPREARASDHCALRLDFDLS